MTRRYVNRDGEETERLSVTFDPWLKTKLYVLAGCFLKAGGPYRKVYDDYKHRLEHHPNWVEKSVGHRHNAAMRFAVKQFLLDFWREWRTLEGLPVVPSYAEAKLGMTHHDSAA